MDTRILYNRKYSRAEKVRENFLHANICSLFPATSQVWLFQIGLLWSDFDKQGLILKLGRSSTLKFAKFSCREIFLFYSNSFNYENKIRLFF